MYDHGFRSSQNRYASNIAPEHVAAKVTVGELRGYYLRVENAVNRPVMWTLQGDLLTGLLDWMFVVYSLSETYTLGCVDEGRKRVLLIAASILAARKLAQYDGGKRVPATVAAIADAVRWAEEIMREIDSRWPK
jgi:hypothetical protein